MILLYPAATGVFRAEENQNRRLELRNLMLAKGLARQTTRQDAIQFAFVGFGKQHHVQRMVRNFTTVSGEVIQTFSQRGLEIGKATDIGVRHFAQLRHVVVEGRLFDIEGFVRTPAWQHFHGEGAVFSDGSVMLERIDRIVGGADHFHIHLLHDAASGEALLRQQIVALIPDFVRRSRREDFTCNTKRTTQLKMRPVV